MYQVTNNQFLEVIFSSKASDEYLWINHHAGDPAEYNKNGKGGQFWAGKRIHKFDECPPDSDKENAYFSVSLLRIQARRIARAKQYASQLPIVVLDDANNIEFTPTYQLETSAGNYQIGLMLDQPIRDVEVGSRLMNELVRQNRVASDKNGNNVVRYARLPAGSNGKYDPPYRHQMIQWNPERIFTLQEICDYLELDFDYITTNTPTKLNNSPITPKNSFVGLGNILAIDRAVNDMAMANFPAWVGELFPQAKESGGNYRVSSQSLGRPLQEDISIHVDGIKDFGVADQGDPRSGKRTPIELVAEHQFQNIANVIEAEIWLRERLRSPAIGFSGGKNRTPIKAGTDIPSLFQSLTLNKEDVSNMADAEFLIPNMIVRGHLLSFVSPGNGGKTTIFTYLCKQLAEQGLNVLYINVDGSPADLKRHYEHASEHGYKVIAPDAKTGKSTDDVLAIFEAIATGEAKCDDVVIIIDTLKKFLDVINKQHSKKFYKMLRAITVKGATICLLGHTNKWTDADGKQVYEGTGDTRNDVDELIYLDSCPNTLKNTLEVTTRPDKVRAEFYPKSFIIQLPNRKVTEAPSPINILAQEDKKLLELMNDAIGSGLQSQQDIVAYVESRTSHSTKKIRTRLIKFSQNNPPDIVACKTGVRKEIHYELAPSLPSLFAGVMAK
jgi:hypothetical protein